MPCFADYGCWPSGDANGTYWKVANLNTTHVKVCPEPYTGISIKAYFIQYKLNAVQTYTFPATFFKIKSKVIFFKRTNVTVRSHVYNTLVQLTRWTDICTMQIRSPVVFYE